MKKIRINDPNLEKLFIEHCEAGWSTTMFAGKLRGGYCTYYKLLKTNQRFVEISNFFKAPRRRWKMPDA